MGSESKETGNTILVILMVMNLDVPDEMHLKQFSSKAVVVIILVHPDNSWRKTKRPTKNPPKGPLGPRDSDEAMIGGALTATWVEVSFPHGENYSLHFASLTAQVVRLVDYSRLIGIGMVKWIGKMCDCVNTQIKVISEFRRSLNNFYGNLFRFKKCAS